MAEQKTDREAILGAAEALLRRKGYGNTTMADIGRATGLLKGSVYHYFPSKEALAEAILERVRAEFRERVFRYAHDSGRPASERLSLMVDEVEAYFRRTKGCLMGHLGLEVTEWVPDFNEPIRGFFEEWVTAFTHVLSGVYDEETARKLAEDSVARVEGAVTWLRIFDRSGPLERACADIRRLM